MNIKINIYICCIYVAACLDSCSADRNKPEEKAQGGSKTVAMPEVKGSQTFFLKTFEVKNEQGASQGWGYDIYIDSVRTIHQEVIPAISGVHSFKTEKEASLTGNYAISKMKSSGNFPTLTIEELDSLGVTK
ncbi:MAG: hypothetical protein K0Q95_590 [Bacteroidota bacterium]|jgi:hypothetical protein|nr:hypothetical protein [Bacteroidota bacterium]